MFAKWMHKHLNRKVSHYKSERFPVFLVYHLWDKASILWVGTAKRGSSWPTEHKCLKFSLGYRELRCVCWGKGKQEAWKTLVTPHLRNWRERKTISLALRLQREFLICRHGKRRNSGVGCGANATDSHCPS